MKTKSLILALFSLCTLQPMKAMEKFPPIGNKNSLIPANSGRFITNAPRDENINDKLVRVCKYQGGWSIQDIEKWILAGADVNLRSEKTDYTPLMEAAEVGNEKLCILLLKHGADVNARSNDGFTALKKAISKRREHLYTLFLDQSAQLNIDFHKHVNDALLYAAQRGNLQACHILLKYGAHADASDSDGETALALAIGNWKMPICYLLVQYGATLHSQDNNGLTPLMRAAKHSFYINVRDLVWQYNRYTVAGLRTLLLCLNRMRQNDNEPDSRQRCAGVLYSDFKTLMLPHLGYTPIRKLLAMQDNSGKTAYDHHPGKLSEAWLKPQ